MDNAPEADPPLACWPADRSQPVLEQTVGDALRAAAQAFGSRIALVEPGEQPNARRQWRFAELLASAEGVARTLLRRFSPGDHVAIWSPNNADWILLEFGAALAGLTLVTVNPAYQAEELDFVLRQSKTVGLIAAPVHRGRDLLAVIEQVRPRLPLLRDVLTLADLRDLAAGSLASRSDTFPAVTPDAIAQIQYTSGTTGFPKGAMLRHRGLVNNARFFAQAIGAASSDIWVNPMPLFHTAGCGLVTLGALQSGGTQVLPAGFDPGRMLQLIEAERGTITITVPTMLIGMLEHADRPDRDLGSWRLAALGGAPVPLELIRTAERTLGAHVAVGFGQTEASPYITHTSPADPGEDWYGTVGRPLPQTEVRIVDPDTGEVVPTGHVGEVCARGYGVMAGYFDDPRATAAAIDADRWLHTGDLGTMNAKGYVRIEGRLKDMIIRGGENIYPREIEELLFRHPAVADVAVVGVPDPTWGETVVAFIRPAAGASPDAEALFAYCRQHLAPYKTPRGWRFVDRFPQTASGKVQKFVLREQFIQEAVTRSDTSA